MKTKWLSQAVTAFGGLLFFFTAPAALEAQTQVLHGHMPAVVKSLQPAGRLPGTNRLNLAIGLPLRNQAALSNLLQQIYDPASPNYHRYLTPEQFTERFGPTEWDYQAVIAFAGANGLRVTATHPNRMLLDVTGNVPDVEKAFHVTMRTYRHPIENRTFFAPDTEPSLDLAAPILRISGLNNYSLPRPRFVAKPLVNGQNASPNSGSGPGGSYMGNDFRAAYVPDSSLTGSGQIVGLLQFDGYTASDITYYESQAGLPNVTLQNVLLDGFNGVPTGSGGEVEVSLDIEMAISMAPGLSKVIVYEAGPSGNWHDILNRMATDNLAKQLSCSWYDPGGVADALADQIFQQMAAQGQSFFSASGDNDAFTGLIDFPGDTPYITQVGGTTLTTSGLGGAWVSETVWNWGGGTGSGGGISTQYPIPDWQTNISMTANQGSTTKRNTPDVALTADNVYVRANGTDQNAGGTSCAAPLWAGFAALVNQQATAAGRPAIGFINPAVESIGTGANYTPSFHDITTGNNESPGSPTKFLAVGGYDLCTGWGTPAGQSLINALAPLVVVTLPASATEGDGLLVGAGQIRLPAAQTLNVVVGLTSSDPAQVSVPANVTVFTGQSNAVFDLTILDDGVLDGTQIATITASVPGSGTGSASMTIFDKETATLQLSLPATVTKGQGTVQGTVQVSAPVAANVIVGLSSSSTNLIQVPASVIIPSGQTSAVFTATVLTDGQINGGQTVNVTAHVQNWTDGTAAVAVRDNVSLTVTLPASAWENAGVLTNAGSVRISGTLPSGLMVSLASGNPAKLTVASSVTIPAGQISNAFNLTVTDNSIADGHQTVTVTASATGFTNGSASMIVLDDESPPIPSNPRPENFATNVPASVNLMWDNGTANELVLNGGFELGTMDNWKLTTNSSNGHFLINNGTVDPPSPDGALPPFGGGFSALGTESGPGIFYMYQDVSIPSGATSATLSWAHRVRNFYSSFSSLQQFQVRICDLNNNVLATPFTTNPGDPLLGDWVQKTCDVTSFTGQTVRVMFWVNPGGYYLDVHVDDASLKVNGFTGTITNDVYFGTNPTPGPAEFQGSTTNSSWTLPLLSPLTTYYWQIVARRVGSVTGAVWQFTTAGMDHFLWNTIPSPQYVDQLFGVTVTAKDAFNTTVSNFTGTVGLSANIPGSGSTIVVTEIDPNTPDFVEFMNVSASSTNISGWQITLYDIDTYPNPLINFVIPANTVVPAGGVFRLIEVGTSPGAYPTFYTGINIDWIADSTIPVAVLVRNSSGVIMDFACAGSAVSTAISNPVTIPTNQWTGGSIPGNSTGLNNYQRVGNQDHNNNVDWLTATPSPGQTNTGLAFPFVGGNTPISISLTNSGNFVAGTWSGNIAISQPATNIVLKADDGSGYTGSSNPFDAVLTNDISVSIVDSPHPVSVGASLTYTLTVANTGPADATGVTVTNTLPASAAFVSATSSQGACAQSGGVVTCNLGVVPDGTNATIAIVVVPTIAGVTLTNVATITRGEADAYPGNNTAVAMTPVTTPAISIADASVVEGNVGTTNMIFAVTLAVSSAQIITVQYATVNVSATAGSDYASTNGILTFPPGTTNGTIKVAVIGDTLIESNETFSVNLSNPVNGVLGRSAGVGTIINDDGLPGQVDHFNWSTISSPQLVGLPFSATITAKDAFNTTVSNFTGSASLSATAGQAEILRVDFENGLQGFNINNSFGSGNGLWHVSSGRGSGAGHSPSQSLYYGHNEGLGGGGNYNTGTANGGTVTSPGVVLPSGGGAITLSFDYLMNVESGTIYDQAFVEVSTNNGASYIAVASKGAGLTNSTGGLWVSNSVALTQFAGRTILLRFRFDTIDGVANDTEGWYLDDIVIRSGAGGGGVISWTPTNTGAFTAGTWSGNITVQQPATNIYLKADDGNGHTGSSNPFDVVAANMPPVVLTQPISQTNYVHGSATFTVMADGTPPLAYQWNFNGANILGATNATLILTDIQLTQAGIYSAAITNAYGSTNSSNAMLTVLVALSCDPVPSGLVSWWQGEGNADDVISGNNGILQGGINFASGEVGQAFNFNNTNEDVFIPASSTLNVGTGNGFTLEAWINPTNAAVSNPIFEWNPNDGVNMGVQFNLFPNGQLYANIVDTSGNLVPGHRFWTATGVVTYNEFQHLALTYDKTSGLATMFRNGELVAQQNLGIFTPLTSYNLYLGYYPLSAPWGTATFTGELDELCLYNRALSASEIAAVYNAGSAGKCPLPPTILVQPTNQTVVVGGSAAFSVTANGTAPLFYQWSFKGTNILGATNTLLTLNNVQAIQAGTYVVKVANAGGSTNSANAVLTVNTPSSCDPAPSGLVAWWKGDGDGNDSVGANNATVPSGVTYAPGEVGLGFNLNGNTNRILAPDAPQLNFGSNQNFSVEVWIQPLTNPGNYQDIMTVVSKRFSPNSSSAVGYEMYLAGGTVAFQLADTLNNIANFNSTGPDLRDGKFHHVAVTVQRNSTTGLLFYVDGKVISTFDPRAIPGNLSNTSPLRIGNHPDPGLLAFYHGIIDEVSLYNRALSSNEIAAIYNAGSAGKCFTPTPPVIISQPTNQTVVAGSMATFAVTVTGSAPLRYQWIFNGTNIAGKTNGVLVLTNVPLNKAGSYALLVTNAYGSILSSNATLVVNPLLYFVWNQIPSPRFANTPFAVVIQAQNLANGIVTNFTGTVVLLSTNGLPVSPAVSGNFIQGVWTGAVTVAQTATNLVLQATDNLGDSGLANPINIINLPALTPVPLGGTLYILWPVNPSGFVLETTAGLSPANWIPITTPPLPIGNQYLLPIQMSGTNAFYRLRFNGP